MIDICIKWEQQILGNEHNFTKKAFSSLSQPSKVCIDIVRYIFENIIEWDPYQICDYLNEDIMQCFRLERIMSYIDYPLELVCNTHKYKTLDPKNLWYISHVLYPNIIGYDKVAKMIEIYEDLLSGRYIKMPKIFFDGFDGEEMLVLVFNYAIDKFISDLSSKELYEYFNSKTNSILFFKKAKLLTIYYERYSTPLDMLHDNIRPEYKNDFYYLYYKFNPEFKKGIKQYANYNKRKDA